MSSVEYELHDHVAEVTMNEPETLNAFSPGISSGMADAFERFRDDPDAWVAILHGNGRAFCSGANVKSMGRGETEPTAPAPGLSDRYWVASPMDGIQVGMNLFKPVIAAIHGYAIGMGLSIALSCDFRIAAEGTQFGFPEARMGIPPAIGAVRAARILGIANALELVLLADRIDTDRALRMNLIREVVPQSALMDAARDLARRLCMSTPVGLRSGKELVLRSMEMSMESALRWGGAIQALAGQSSPEDRAEGIRSINERRAPNFTGL